MEHLTTREQAQVCRDRAQYPKTKGLLYGGDDRPETPQRKGTKGPPGGMMMSEAPFATFETGDDVPRKEYHAIAKIKDYTDKAGVALFGADVYSANLHANHVNMEESKARNNGSNRNTQSNGSPGISGPFAASFNASMYPENFALLPSKRKEGAGKISGQAYESEVYRDNLIANQQLHEASIARKGGCGGPWATDGNTMAPRGHEYVAKRSQKEVVGKVGTGSSCFEPSVYAANLAANQQQQHNSVHRNFEGSGNILGFTGN